MTMPILVLIEEMHRLSRSAERMDIGSPILPELFRTGAKRGIQMIVTNQLLSDIPQDILGNAGIKMVGRSTEPKCILVAQQSQGLSREQAARLPNLERQEFIVQFGGCPSPFLLRVFDVPIPPKPAESELEEVTTAFLKQLVWGEDGIDDEQSEAAATPARPDPDALSGDALLVLARIAEAPETIEERMDALRIDRTREVRARRVLEAKGLIAAVEQTLGSKVKFYELTAKGIDWTHRHGIKVKKYKSGPVHEYILRHTEQAICVLSPKFSFQRHSEIAREQDLQPDSVAHLPGGQRAIIEVCCSNMDYDARNLVKERQLAGVDMVIAIAPNRMTREALERAVEKARPVEGEGNRAATLVLLDASECLSPDFDWITNVFERST
jgi:DNA-binding PadR family transcriptional regulator